MAKGIGKSREYTETSFSETSQDGIVMLSRNLHKQVDTKAQTVSPHSHTYHLIREYRDFENSKVYSKFACLCGAVKRVEQFEEEQ